MATAAEVVATLKDALAVSPGVKEITVDGLKVVLEPGSLDYWEKRAAREASPKTRPICATIDLSGGMG